MIELRRVTKAEIAALIRKAEAYVELECWALYIARGPVRALERSDGPNLVTLRTDGPKPPYDGALFFFWRSLPPNGEPASSADDLRAMKARAALGQFNSAAFPARFPDGRTIEDRIAPAFWT